MKRSSWASGSGYVPSYSIGFCVAITRNGRASSWVCTSTVTFRSCMHSSSPDCVFGEARLISSTSTTFANTGPGRNSNRFSRWLKTLVPTTSAGSRSAVHWMRAYSASTERASALASAVFPTPGLSSISTCPSASRATITVRSVSSGTFTARATLAAIRPPSAATSDGSIWGTVPIQIDLNLRAAPAGALALLSLRRLLRARQVAGGGLRIARAHEDLSHEHGVHAHLLELLDLVAVRDARLGHDGLASRDVDEQVVGALEVDREVLEVAVVDADQVGVELERQLELLLVVHLHQGVDLERAGHAVEGAERVGAQRPDHEQDRVGAIGLGLVDLVRVEREVLAQDRQLGDRPGGAQVVERAPEVVPLREHRQRRCAAALVGADDLLDLGALADDPGGRGAALVLRHERGAGMRERLGEGAALACRRDLGLERRQRPFALARLQSLARGGDQLVESEAHADAVGAIRARP